MNFFKALELKSSWESMLHMKKPDAPDMEVMGKQNCDAFTILNPVKILQHIDKREKEPIKDRIRHLCLIPAPYNK